MKIVKGISHKREAIEYAPYYIASYFPHKCLVFSRQKTSDDEYIYEMIKYSCDLCKYSSCDKFNYSRHEKTARHCRKVSENKMSSNSYPTSVHTSAASNAAQNLFTCPYCKNAYSSAGNLSKHKKKCHIKDDIVKKYEDMIKDREDRLELKTTELQSTIETHKTVLASKNAIIAILQNQVNNLLTLLNSAGSIVKKSMSTLNYIVTHYTNAPKLEPIKNIERISEHVSCKDFVRMIASEYNHKTLAAFVGNFILADYKKDNPAVQSVWNSDANRLTYIVRHVINESKYNWHVDKKGLMVYEYIIGPVLEHIGVQMRDYIERTSEKIKRRKFGSKVLNELVSIQHDAVHILKSIEDGTLGDAISKYLAPRLHFANNTNHIKALDDNVDEVGDDDGSVSDNGNGGAFIDSIEEDDD